MIVFDMHSDCLGTPYAFYLSRSTLQPEEYYLLLFSPSLRMVPIFLSDRASRPSGFLIVPGGKPCFFSCVPTVWSLLSLFAISDPPFMSIVLDRAYTACLIGCNVLWQNLGGCVITARLIAAKICKSNAIHVSNLLCLCLQHCTFHDTVIGCEHGVIQGCP